MQAKVRRAGIGIVTSGCQHPTRSCGQSSVWFRQNSSRPNDQILDYLAVCSWPTAEVGFSAVKDRKLCKTADGLFRKVGAGETSATRQPSYKLIVELIVSIAVKKNLKQNHGLI